MGMTLSISRCLMPVAALAATLAITTPSAHAAACAGADAAPSQLSGHAASAAVRCLINAQRASHGLSALKSSRALDRAASGYAVTMVRRNCFSHNCTDLISRVLKAGASINGSLGENIGMGGGPMGTPRAMVTAWMHSAGHRHNILNPRFHRMGAGVANGSPGGQMGGGSATWVTDFSS